MSMISGFTKALVVSLFCAISQPCWAEELRALVEKVQAKETKLGNMGTRLWTVKQEDPYSPMFGREFVWIRLSGTVRWRVRDVQRSEQVRKIFESAPKYEREITIQGGFFGEKQDGTFYALGLIISDGKRRSSKMQWSSGGVLYARDGVTKIDHVSSVTNDFSAQQAIQSKPLVVENGQNGIYTPDKARFNRVGVGISKSGNIVVAGVFSPDQEGATLFGFAEALIAFGALLKDPLVSAIAMDGGPGAHIYISDGQRLFGYDGETFVPNVIDFGIRAQMIK
jgi:hypothetical protein